MLSKIKGILAVKYPIELADKIVELYSKILLEYRKKEWKNCIGTIGQFNEACFRVINLELTANYISLKDKLPNFTNNILNQWEQYTGKDEVFRTIIPRMLFSMYCLRSKRGAVHLSNISANEIDTTVLLYQTKWILAELIRIVSNISFEETTVLIKQLISRENEIIWDAGKNLRVLCTKLSAQKQILCLLYSKDKLSDKELFDCIEYTNFSLFKSRLLKDLHKKRFIEYDAPMCILSPTGMIEAEKILNKI